MPQALSLDLRQRAVDSYLNGEGTQAEVAQRFCVAVRSLRSWVALARAGEPLAARPHSGGRGQTKLTELHRDALTSWLEENNELTCRELASKLLEDFALNITPSQLSRRLKGWGWTRKKKRWEMTAASAATSSPREATGSGGS